MARVFEPNDPIDKSAGDVRLPYSRCGNCGYEYAYDADLAPVNHLWERVSPGEMMPLGACLDEKCDSLVHPIDDLDRVEYTPEFLTWLATEVRSYPRIVTAGILHAKFNAWNHRVQGASTLAEQSVSTPTPPAPAAVVAPVSVPTKRRSKT